MLQQPAKCNSQFVANTVRERWIGSTISQWIVWRSQLVSSWIWLVWPKPNNRGYYYVGCHMGTVLLSHPDQKFHCASFSCWGYVTLEGVRQKLDWLWRLLVFSLNLVSGCTEVDQVSLNASWDWWVNRLTQGCSSLLLYWCHHAAHQSRVPCPDLPPGLSVCVWWRPLSVMNISQL